MRKPFSKEKSITCTKCRYLFPLCFLVLSLCSWAIRLKNKSPSNKILRHLAQLINSSLLNWKRCSSFKIFAAFLLLISIPACNQDQPLEQAHELSELGATSDDYETNPNQWGYIDSSGQLTISNQFDEVRAFSEGLALVRRLGKWGFIDKTGKIQIECKYRAAWSFENGLARVQNEEGLFGFISASGVLVIEQRWSEATNFREGMSCVRNGNKYGFINPKGVLVVAAKYDRPSRFYNNYAVVKEGDRYGMINQVGDLVIPSIYDQLKPFENSMARAKKDGNYGFLNIKGQWAVYPIFVQASNFNNDHAPAFDGQLWGLINRKGDWAIVPKYNQLFWAAENRWIAEKNESYYLIDEKDHAILKKMDEIHPFKEDLAAFRRGDLWGFINNSGEIVMPAMFYLAWPFHNGYARVATDIGLTYIDRDGFFLMPPNPFFLEIRDFSEGLASVQVYNQ